MRFHRQGALLNALMQAALVAAMTGAIRRFAPAWQPGYVIVACFLVALEASFVHHMYRVERMWLAELLRYLVPELTVMLVLMRIATTLSLGGATLATDALGWLYDPLSIFDPPFIAFIVAGLIVGGLTHAGMRDLSELAPQPFEGPAPLSEGNKQYGIVVAHDRAAALRRISARFVGGGVLLLCMLGIEAVNLEQLTGPARPIAAVSAAGALLYLISGFLLYSQARLALLQARWRLDGVQVADTVERRWGRASRLLIVGVALAALVLPRTYGLGLLDTLRGILGIIGYAIALLGYIVLWLFSLLALLPAWLFSLLAPLEGATPPPAPPAPPPAPPPPTPFEPRLLPALIFWACMIALVGYACWIVVQRHPGLLRALTRSNLLAWARRWCGWLWRDTRSWVGQAAHSLQVALRRPAVSVRRRMPSLRLRRLAPRDLVRYFYRSTLRRAAARGLPRRAGQTPYEYSAVLGDRIPDAREDIATLTEAFVVAQYSPRTISPDDARRVRRPWERVRRRLRTALEQREPPV
jgi:hypothetical protein